ncbi:MAG: alpha-hydroxy-acid oxidizing protein [Burkholderiales bacterium]|nr:alpha-hydroxy-acid oxidizing protein [Burkholderiales bacterium]
MGKHLNLPPGLVTLADHREHARRSLDARTWAYFDGGAADEITLRANRAAWEAIRLRPRVLADLSGFDPGTALLGRAMAAPVLVAPMAHQGLAHPDAERGTALAAAALGVGLVLATQSGTPLEEVARASLPEPDRGPLWFQLYWLGNRAWVRELVDRARRAGYEAIVLTVDAPVQGVRDAERRAGFTLPPGLESPHAPPVAKGARLAALLQQAATWDDVAWLASESTLPVLLKGITHPADAALALEAGAAGIIVSNHGGRVLDTLPATAAVLPEIAAAVDGRVPVLVDGGIRRGTDVVKALALGADAVLVGRPVLHGLANAGAAGVAHVLRLLLDEFMAAMALCGKRRVAGLRDAGLVEAPSRP